MAAVEPNFDTLLKDLTLCHQRQLEQIAALRQENDALRALLGRCSAGELDEDHSIVQVAARTSPWPRRLLTLSLLNCLPVVGGCDSLENPCTQTDSVVASTTMKSGRSRTTSVCADEAPVCGVWVDTEKSFFAGSCIHIWSEGWKPLDPPEASRASYFTVLCPSATAWELLETRADGSTRSFHAERVKEKLRVRCEEDGEKWLLERTGAHTGISSSMLSRQLPPMWPEWQDESEVGSMAMQESTVDNVQANAILAAIVDSRASVLRRDVSTGEAEVSLTTRIWDNVVMRPSSLRRILWDFLSCFMVIFDVFTVPLVVFDPDLFTNTSLHHKLEMEQGMVLAMSWITTLFWTLDVPMSLLTGFHSNGVIELRPRPIARDYLRTWAFFDVGILLPDWFFLLFPSVQAVGILRLTKGVRFMRVFRAIRLLRFVRLQRFLHDLVEMINSESLRALFTIVLALGFIITLNHYVACGWYFLGRVGLYHGRANWIEDTLHEPGAQSAEELYGYMTSLHWSLTQFTPASMEVHPVNVGERMYSIAVLLFAMVTFSSFLASITAAITNLRSYATETSKQKHLLRRFFVENRVPNELGNRIWSYLNTNHFKQQRMHKTDVQALQSLTGALKKELCTALHLPYITRLPVFNQLVPICLPLLADVCDLVSERSLLREEELFTKGMKAEVVLILFSGTLTYNHSDARLRREVQDAGAWVCEQVLWVEWRHCGQLVAKNSCEIMTLQATAFRSAIMKANHARAVWYLKHYARGFYEHLQMDSDLWRTDLMSDEAFVEGLAANSRNEMEEAHAPPQLRRSSDARGFFGKRFTSARSNSSLDSSGTVKRPVSFDLNFD